MVAACSATPTPCERAVAAQRWDAARVSCEAEHAATGEPGPALAAARAALYAGRSDDAIRIAQALVATSRGADARTVLGPALRTRGRYGEAYIQLTVAAWLHGLARDLPAQARDLHQLAGVWFELGEYEAADRAMVEARRAATSAGDDTMRVPIAIAHADILRGRGRAGEAEQILGALRDGRSGPLPPADRVYVELKLGILHLGEAQWSLAREPLESALRSERAAASPRPNLLASLCLNLASVERNAGAFDRALGYVDEAGRLDTDELDHHLARGLVLADAGRLAEAARALDAAEAAVRPGQWGYWVAYHRARVASRLGDEVRAIEWLRVAIERVAVLATSSGSWGPTVVATHREPHLELIGLLARRAAWTEVLEVIASMDAQALLDSKEARRDRSPSTVLLPRARLRQPAPARRGVPVAQIVEAWRGRTLVIVVPGGGRLWRLELAGGELRGTNVGDAAQLETLAYRVEGLHADAGAARTLGEAIVPDHVAPGARVDLLLVGPVSRAPLALLRHGAAPAIARWRLVRVLGVIPRPHHRSARDGVVVIGDPSSDLAASGAEARRVAQRLGGRALIGRAATRERFHTALGARLLHVAAHTEQRSDGALLVLSDGRVAASEIAAAPSAPELVVLASCAASVGRDDAGNGSLAAAFLDAGARTVIGTQWAVRDGEAAAVIEAFYAAGGDRDPEGALLAVQLAPPPRASPATWAAFEAIVARPVER